MSSTSFLIAERREFGDVHVPMKVTERNKSDKSDSIVSRFYFKRLLKTSMVALIADTCTRSATNDFKPFDSENTYTASVTI